MAFEQRKRLEYATSQEKLEEVVPQSYYQKIEQPRAMCHLDLDPQNSEHPSPTGYYTLSSPLSLKITVYAPKYPIGIFRLTNFLCSSDWRVLKGRKRQALCSAYHVCKSAFTICPLTKSAPERSNKADSWCWKLGDLGALEDFTANRLSDPYVSSFLLPAFSFIPNNSFPRLFFSFSFCLLPTLLDARGSS